MKVFTTDNSCTFLIADAKRPFLVFGSILDLKILISFIKYKIIFASVWYDLKYHKNENDEIDLLEILFHKWSRKKTIHKKSLL